MTKDPTEETEGEQFYPCTVYGATKTETISVIGHEHSYEAVVIAPTCTKRSYTIYTCSCDESHTANYVNALGHTWGDWIVIREPTTTENGITNGTSVTTFVPNDQCMRIHGVTFLWWAVGFHEPKLMVNPFVDVKLTDFYYKPILWVLENGITSGMDATHFVPTAYYNSAQVVIWGNRHLHTLHQILFIYISQNNER